MATITAINRKFERDKEGNVVRRESVKDIVRRQEFDCRNPQCKNKIFVAEGQVVYPVCKDCRRFIKKR